MPTWMRRLASLKLTVVLLALFVLILAAGTIVEALYGAPVARAVYFAPWFLGLQVLFAVNLLCSLVERWPWERQRLGFALTHTSLLIILAGALVTLASRQEGQLALWEGESGNQFVEASTPGQVTRHPLPFAIVLEEFQIDYYPGGRRPAMYRSRVRVSDATRDDSFPAVIEMNRPLTHRGFRFFQSSYRQDSGREMSILLVSRDYGQPLAFVGYVLLLAGMTTVLLTRLYQRRQAAAAGLAPADSGGPSRTASPFKVVRLLLGAVVLPAGIAAAGSTGPHLADAATVRSLRYLPVQHDGRIMPLDTLAREATWRVTGERRWRDADPVALVLGWTLSPAGWSTEPLVQLDGPALAAAIGLPAGPRHVAVADLASNPRLLALIQEARGRAQLDQRLTPLQQAARTMEDRLLWLQRFLSGRALRVMPASQADGTWSVPVEIRTEADLIALQQRLAAEPPPHYPSSAEMRREVNYNLARPSRLAWLLLGLAVALAAAGNLRPRRLLDRLTLLALLAGFAVMTWGLATRWQIAGRIPASNMYESMLFLAWGVGLFAVIASLARRQRFVVLNAAAVSAVAMALVDLLPMDPFIHPMPPVLTGTPWLAIHVPITMISYSVFAIGVLIAHAEIGVELFAPSRHRLTTRLDEALYFYMHVGSILLAAGILTGSIWAASSWGRYWGWDPKEVWSLIALLAYMGILHGRVDRLVGRIGVAALSILAFWAVLMTYLGVNFVLAAGLHTYGFGQSSVTRWLVAAATLEIGFLIAATAVLARRGTAASASPAPSGR